MFTKLKRINLESLVSNEVLKTYNIKSKQKLADELRKFLSLLEANNGKMLAPSLAVDEVYHELLENKLLRKKVEAILQGDLIHNPGIKGKRLEKMYDKTLSLYRRSFGDDKLSIWED